MKNAGGKVTVDKTDHSKKIVEIYHKYIEAFNSYQHKMGDAGNSALDEPFNPVKVR